MAVTNELSRPARWSRLLAIGVALSFLATACGSSTASGPTASAPGITATTITIGSTQPLTGPAAPGYSEISKASNAYFQWVNDHGGVLGRKIVYQYEDDGYNPTNTTTITRKQVLQDKVFAEFNQLGTPTHLSVVDYLNDQKVPDLFVASGCNCWNTTSNHPYTYGWQPDYTIEGQILGQYINRTYLGQKVAYFAQDDEFGADGVKGLDLQIANINVASRQKYVPTNTNIGAQIAAIQASGAKVVVLYSIPAFTALMLLGAAKVGFHPTWVVSSVGSDPTTLTGLVSKFSKGAAGAALLEGIVSSYYLPNLTAAADPWIKIFQQIHDKYISDLPFDGNVEYGLAAAYTFVDLMTKAGQNPTRQDVIDTLNGGKVSRGPGLAPLGYSKDNHLGFLGERVFTIQGGKTVPQGAVYTSTDTGPIQAFTDPELAPPANGIPTP
jgi:ABC-type branched-subunit amino acid transport system substrate-binding protein